MATYIFPSAIVVEVLRDDNYENWRSCIKSYMLAQGLWDIVEPATIRTPNEKDPEADSKAFDNQEGAQVDSKASDSEEIAKANCQTSDNQDIANAYSTAANNQEGADSKKILDQVEHSEAPDSGEIDKADDSQTSDHQEGARADTDTSDNQDAAKVDSKAPDNQEGAQTVCKKVPGDQEVAKADSKALDNQGRAQTDSEDWCKRNAAALHAIQISCAPDILSKIRNIDSAKKVWDTLATMQKLQLSTAEPQLSGVNAGLLQNEHTRWLELYKHAHEGNWDATKRFLDHHPDAINAKITPFGGTALHVATVAGNVQVVEKLVELMSPEDLEILDNYGCSALSYAAMEGITKMAKCMIRKNNKLVNLPNGVGRIPVVVSCIGNHKDMTHYLYSVTPFELLYQDNGNHGSLLLQFSIICKMFDIALDLLHHFPSLATALDKIWNSNAVFQLSNMPDGFPSGSQLAFWQRWIYPCIHIGPLIPCIDHMHSDLDQSQSESKVIMLQALSRPRKLVINILKFLGIKQIYDVKLNHMYSVELLRRVCEHISTLDVQKYVECGILRAFNRAIENGIVELIVKMVKFYPNLMYTLDENGRNIFMSSIAHRQEKIFSLFYGLEGSNGRLISVIDNFENTMLHCAGVLSPSTQLTRISGAALQMQRELQWYQEVESIVNPMAKIYRNRNGETPGQLFTKNHKQLMADGEKWMKATATSSTVVGALIITVMFTAAFTVPGGNKDTGFPVFLHKKPFLTFIISDAISLFASSTSVLMFLGILTSRYSEKDFLKSLPTKLVIGLSMLFISIATMMVAFCAALIIVLDRRLEVVIPISLLAGIPVTLFILLQFPLLVEIFISTYGPGIFNRKMKRWY